METAKQLQQTKKMTVQVFNSTALWKSEGQLSMMYNRENLPYNYWGTSVYKKPTYEDKDLVHFSARAVDMAELLLSQLRDKTGKVGGGCCLLPLLK